MRMKRFEGRLFAQDGCLFMVVAVDEAQATARVSCRLEAQQVLLEMPLDQVTRHIGASSSLQLDNLHSPDSRRRLVSEKDGWYFSSREGNQGPFESEDEAASALARYVLAMQTQRDEPRKTSKSRQRSPNPSAGTSRQSTTTADRMPRRRLADRASMREAS